MLTETFRAISVATRNVCRDWRSLVLIALIYASLLAALYFFVAVREASIGQVVLTFALAIAAPLLFFVLQAMIADPEQRRAGSLLKESLSNFWKLLLISLPLIALAVLTVYLLGKAQAHFDANARAAAAALPRRMTSLANSQQASPPIDWRAAMLSTIRYLTLGLVLPLVAIHLWLATAREGLGMAVRRVGTHLARAFAPQSVLIYIAGFLIFGVVPYFLLFRNITTKHAWLELSLLAARLTIVFALTLLGWMITVRALSLFPARAPNDQGGTA